MAFFNPNPESTDLELLPKALRDDEDLAAIAAECEAAIVARFTGVVHGCEGLAHPANVGYAFLVATVPYGAYALDEANGLYVFLRGYDPTLADCDANLATALKREIAALIRWRQPQWRMNPVTASESSGQGEKAVSYRDDKNALFPPTFGQYLRPYDICPPAAAI